MFTKKFYTDSMLADICDILSEADYGKSAIKDRIKKQKELIDVLNGHIKDYQKLYDSDSKELTEVEKYESRQKKITDKVKSMFDRENEKLTDSINRKEEIRQRQTENNEKIQDTRGKIDELEHDINQLKNVIKKVATDKEDSESYALEDSESNEKKEEENEVKEKY